MPYNNTPIAPNQEITGTVALPLARVKKIIHADEDISNCSNNAAFAMTVATEQFLQYLVEKTYNIVKTEKKPRRNIQYKDVANAVARNDNLEFLSDVVPRTQTYKAYKAKKAQKKDVPAAGVSTGDAAASVSAGDGVIDVSAPSDHADGADPADDAMEIDEAAEEEEGSEAVANGNGSASGA